MATTGYYDDYSCPGDFKITKAENGYVIHSDDHGTFVASNMKQVTKILLKLTSPKKGKKKK